MNQNADISDKKHTPIIYDYEYEAVPLEVRKRWYTIALIWVAIGIDISGLFLGTYLSSGLSFHNAVLATVIGSALLGGIAALCANVGYGTGLTTVLLSSAIFGRVGGKIIGIIISISLLGWFAFQLDFLGTMLLKALAHYEIYPGRLTILCFGVILMSIIAMWGVRSLERLSTFSAPIMVMLLISGIFFAVSENSVSAMSNMNTSIGMGTAISYVVSIWIMAAVMTPDISRYAKTRKDALLGAGIGFLLGNSATILVALCLINFVGNNDLVEVFFSVGFGVSAILILILAQWTTNSCNLVSASLGLSVVFRGVPRPILVIVLACLGLALANNGMVNNFNTFLSLLGVFISPIAGVYLAEYYFFYKTDITKEIEINVPMNLIACFAWLVGCVISLLSSPDFGDSIILTTIPALDGIGVSMMTYTILKHGSKKQLFG